MAEIVLWKALFDDLSSFRSSLQGEKCGEVECPTYTPDFMKLADSYGAKGIHITKKEDIEPAFREAMKSTKTPYILEFDIDPEDLVYPMVKPGGTLEDLIMDC